MDSSPGRPDDDDEVMTLGPYRFDDLASIIDHVHTLFSGWEHHTPLTESLDAQTLHRAKLATHEWLANLVQHAAFQERRPDICVELTLDDRRVRCVIEDNSDGFDLNRHLRTRERLDPCPERGMGLLMLHACTDDLTYRPVGPHHNRLTFTISAGKDPWLDIPFHH